MIRGVSLDKNPILWMDGGWRRKAKNLSPPPHHQHRQGFTDVLRLSQSCGAWRIKKINKELSPGYFNRALIVAACPVNMIVKDKIGRMASARRATKLVLVVRPASSASGSPNNHHIIYLFSPSQRLLILHKVALM